MALVAGAGVERTKRPRPSRSGAPRRSSSRSLSSPAAAQSPARHALLSVSLVETSAPLVPLPPKPSRGLLLPTLVPALSAVQVEVSRRRGVKFVNMALSANTALDAAQLAKLTDALRDAPKPLLIHCRAGSDRTGLASAIYVATHGGSYHDAQNQLSLYYGHFPYLGSKSAAMGISLERFYESLAGRHVVSQVESR